MLEQTACDVVFGNAVTEYGKWIAESIQVFANAEAAGDFEARMQRLLVPLTVTCRGRAFDEACLATREKALAQLRENIAAGVGMFTDTNPEIAQIFARSADAAERDIKAERQRLEQAK